MQGGGEFVDGVDIRIGRGSRGDGFEGFFG